MPEETDKNRRAFLVIMPEIPDGAHIAEPEIGCHSEPVTDVTGVGIRIF